MTYLKTSSLLLAGIATLALLPAAAQAQDQATAAPAAAAPNTDTDGTIVVTAQRRSENDMNVPVAVSVIKPEALTDFHSAGSDTLLTLSGRVPDLYVESSTGRIFPRFYIRGLGNIDFYLGASQPVEIIQDDVVEEHVILKSNPVFDVGQIEVLKGPQGSLFGRNTTAGIIKFDSAQPTETWQGQGSLSYGRFNSVNADAGIGGPLTKDGTISFRLSGLYQHRDNWISNVYTGPSDDGTVPGHNVMNGFDERDLRLVDVRVREIERRRVLLDLRLQDLARRRARRQPLFARPQPLHLDIVAIGEERPLQPLLDRQQEMRRGFPEIQERVDVAGERRPALGELSNPRAQRGIISGILEQPHGPDILTMIRNGRD